MPNVLSHPCRILVVDDNQDAATTLAYLLNEAGYEAEVALNGKTALEIAGRFDPDVCILDINMPGMTGYDVARRIRAMSEGRQPLLATMTAYYDIQHLDRAASAGFDLHFTKPAELDDLIEQIETSLKKQPVAQPQAPTSPGTEDITPLAASEE